MERSNCFLSPPANIDDAIGQGALDTEPDLNRRGDPKDLSSISEVTAAFTTDRNWAGGTTDHSVGSLARSSSGRTPPSVLKLVYGCVGCLPVGLITGLEK